MSVTITDKIIRKETGEYDPEVVKRLKIERYGLQNMSGLDRCFSLIELSLAYNEISAITGLETLECLNRLDLSHNKIRKLDGLDALANLEYLNMVNNVVEELTEVQRIVPLSQLKNLYFRQMDGKLPNPICSQDNYTMIVLRVLPQLEVLDGGHKLVIASEFAIQEYLKGIKPTGDADKPLQIDSWFKPEELEVNLDIFSNHSVNSTDTTRGFHSTESTMEAVRSLEEELLKINSMIDEDGAHLLRKAVSSLSKCEVKKSIK